ncbi:MAG TPA: ABC transporter permease [Puia sp.]|nr:ABC transporter permease [Puia sp.]
MLKNYFKIAYRNLIRNKVFSIINISGLAIGMASAILILLWIQNEVSYDRFHVRGDRLYEAWSVDREKVDGILRSYTPTPEIMAPSLQKDYPEVEAVTRMSWPQQLLFGVGDKSLKASGMSVDTAFLTMFSYPLLRGDPRTALRDAGSLVITEKMAIKLFGNTDVIGKTVKLEAMDNLTVTAVAKDLPNNTQFNFEYLMSYERNTQKGWIDTDWTDFSIRTFVLLKPNVSRAAATEKVKDVIFKYSGGRAKTNIFLYPVSQLRLYSDFVDGKPAGGRIETVRILGIIAAFILLIACINFMNLTTARSEKRAKEVGIRKVAGAVKRSLVFQFLSESVLIATIAGLLALLIVYFSLPAFNQLTEKTLFIDYHQWYSWIAFIGFILFTGILAGSYPSFFLSAFKPVAVLKGSFKKVNALVTPRKLLVILQFSFAIILIVCTIIVEKQINYGIQRKTGYDRNNMIYINLEGDLKKNYGLIKNDLISSGIALSVSQSHAPLTQVWSSGHGLSWKGKDPNAEITFLRSSTDGDLIKTAGFTLVEGRDIDLKTYPSDSVSCLINEAAAKVMGFKNVIGQTIHDDPTTWHVVGVIKDFILESPYEPIKPIIFKGPRSGRNVLNIKLSNTQATAPLLARAEKIFKQYNPAYPFEYHFMDEEYAKKFSSEQLTAKLAAIFSGLTIFISCLGLFGLATYMAEARIKEIGIRKVLGASITSITALLSIDFIKLIIVSILIATPVAYWAMFKWLQGYQYRIAISWKVFMTAGSLALLIALLTVSYQAVRAAIANPVNSLKEM